MLNDIFYLFSATMHARPYLNATDVKLYSSAQTKQHHAEKGLGSRICFERYRCKIIS